MKQLPAEVLEDFSSYTSVDGDATGYVILDTRVSDILFSGVDLEDLHYSKEPFIVFITNSSGTVFYPLTTDPSTTASFCSEAKARSAAIEHFSELRTSVFIVTNIHNRSHVVTCVNETPEKRLTSIPELAFRTYSGAHNYVLEKLKAAPVVTEPKLFCMVDVSIRPVVLWFYANYQIGKLKLLG